MEVQNNQQVRRGEELPEKKLKIFLKSQGLITNEKSQLQVVQFTHGYSNLTYALSIEDKEYILRRPPFGAIKRGHDMHREYRVQKAIKSVFKKVPTMYAFSKDANILDAPFYIMEKIEGIILSYTKAKKMEIPSKDYVTIANSWLNTLVALHQINFKMAGLGDLGKPKGYVARQVSNWGKQYLDVATEEVPAAVKVMRWMEENQPKDYNHSLIHNDYKYDNIVFKDNQWNDVNAVLDWEMSTLGDPLMDLGTSLGYWTLANDHDFVKQGIPSPTVFEGNPERSAIVELYAKKSGQSINNIVFYYVYGLFKIAVIAQQIYFRYTKGFTSDPRFANLNQAAALCCNLAWKAIQTQKID